MGSNTLHRWIIRSPRNTSGRRPQHGNPMAPPKSVLEPSPDRSSTLASRWRVNPDLRRRPARQPPQPRDPTCTCGRRVLVGNRSWWATFEGRLAAAPEVRNPCSNVHRNSIEPRRGGIVWWGFGRMLSPLHGWRIIGHGAYNDIAPMVLGISKWEGTPSPTARLMRGRMGERHGTQTRLNKPGPD